MKILTLALENINSVKGSWSIDFEAEPFAECGLFAITGPTGAGKTTLLDAICLALYHQTPRQKNDQEQLMSRGTGRMSASVSFETQGVRYQASWQLRRARDKADGNLQQQEVSLSREGTLLTDKIREKSALIAEITGLDFVRFTQSVLLAQGGFAAFLNASEGERAALLEELTGTEIYGQLSTLAFERASAERQRIEQQRQMLSAVGVVDAATVQAAEQALQAAEAEALAKQQQRLALLERQRQQQAYRQQQARLVQLTSEYQATDAALKALAPELLKLQRAEQAEQHYPAYQSLQALLAQQQQRQAHLAQTSERATELGQQRSLNAEALAEAKQQLEHHEQALKQAEPLLEALRALEQSIEAKQADWQHTEPAWRDVLSSLDKAQLNLAELKQANALLQQQRQQLRARLAEQQPLAELVPRLPLWQHQIEQLADGQQALSTRHQRQQALERQCQPLRERVALIDSALLKLDEQRQLEQQRCQQLLPEQHHLPAQRQRLEKQWQEHLATVQQLNTLARAEQDAQSADDQHVALEQRVQANAQALSELEEAQPALIQQLQADEQACQQAEQTLESQRLSQALAAYRQQLRAGEPCPLCGAIEHPQPLEIVSEALVAEQVALLAAHKQAFTQRQRQLDKAQAEQQQLRRQRLELSEPLAQARQRAEQQQAECERLRLALPEADRSAPVERLLAQATEAHQQLEASLARFDQLSEQRQASERALESLETQSQHQRSELQQQRQQLALLEHEREQSQEACVALTESVTKQQQALLQALKPYQGFLADVSLDESSLSACYQQLSQALAEYQAEQARDQRLEQQAAEQATALQEQQGLCREIEARREALADQRQRLSSELDALQQRHQAQFAAESSMRWRARLQAACDQAQQDQREALSRFEAVADQAREAEANRSLLTEQCTEAQQQLLEQQSAWQKTIEHSVFDTEALLLEARLSSAEQQHIRQRQQSYQDQRQRLSEQRQQLEQDLHDCLAQSPEVAEDEQRLLEQQSACDQALAQAQQQRGEQASLLRQYHAQADRAQALRQALEQAEQDARDWQYLEELIGSKNGARFRRFAQGLTLQNLLVLANRHLSKLAGRYRLVRDQTQSLALQIEDAWQADHRRDTKTLSGGESFLVSLALALGLSELVSDKVTIDTLFLDEGFGTLDLAALDIALDALDGLQASGKTIGVISHVDSLKERIAVQIQIQKLDGLGYSRLDPQFAQRATKTGAS